MGSNIFSAPFKTSLFTPIFSDVVVAGNYAYGVIWDAVNDTYQTGFYEDGVFTAQSLTSFPIQEQMKRCLLLDSGSINYFLLSTDSTKKADGSAATLTGADGQVMVRIPKFHYIQAQNGNFRYFFIGEKPFWITLADTSIATSAIHPAFYKGGSANPSAYRYIGAYEGSMYDTSASAMVAAADIVTSLYASGDKMCSVSGQYPKVNETIVEFRTMATARGTGWHQFDHAMQAAVAMLYITEKGTLRSQAAIGNGRISLANGDWVASEIHDGTNYGYIGKCGLSDAIGNATGANNEATNLTLAESPAYMSYRGIENWWGNVWKWMDGANIHNSSANGSRLYLCTNYSQYASGTDTNYTLAGTLINADGYVKDILNTLGIWPLTVGGSSATYVADYYYTEADTVPDGGWRVARLGGVAYFGSSAGAFCVISDSASSAASATVGGRLCF